MSLSRQASVWRWFPIGIIGSLLVVMAVNGLLIYLALDTFPGSAGEDGFDMSNGYGRVIDGAARQAQLGWHIEAGADSGGHATLRLLDRDGQVLAHPSVKVVAARPLGPPETATLSLRESTDGRLVAAERLASGQWDLAVEVSQDQQTLSATERLVVK